MSRPRGLTVQRLENELDELMVRLQEPSCLPYTEDEGQYVGLTIEDMLASEVEYVECEDNLQSPRSGSRVGPKESEQELESLLEKLEEEERQIKEETKRTREAYSKAMRRDYLLKGSPAYELHLDSRRADLGETDRVSLGEIKEQERQLAEAEKKVIDLKNRAQEVRKSIAQRRSAGPFSRRVFPRGAGSSTKRRIGAQRNEAQSPPDGRQDDGNDGKPTRELLMMNEKEEIKESSSAVTRPEPSSSLPATLESVATEQMAQQTPSGLSPSSSEIRHSFDPPPRHLSVGPTHASVNHPPRTSVEYYGTLSSATLTSVPSSASHSIRTSSLSLTAPSPAYTFVYAPQTPPSVVTSSPTVTILSNPLRPSSRSDDDDLNSMMANMLQGFKASSPKTDVKALPTVHTIPSTLPRSTYLAPKGDPRSSVVVGGSSRSCGRCGKEVEEYSDSIRAINRQWHPACFTCYACRGELMGPRSRGEGFFPRDGQPLCTGCYRRSYGQ